MHDCRPRPDESLLTTGDEKKYLGAKQISFDMDFSGRENVEKDRE
jgi:hypothetical protein